MPNSWNPARSNLICSEKILNPPNPTCQEKNLNPTQPNPTRQAKILNPPNPTQPMGRVGHGLGGSNPTHAHHWFRHIEALIVLRYECQPPAHQT
jgi:hypothetical protein